MNLQILVNKRILARRTNYTGFEYISKSLNASTLWLGCSVDENGRKIRESTTHGIRVLSVAMWYWPLKNYQLLTGAVEFYLLAKEGETQHSTAINKPMETQIPFGDLEKFVPLPGKSYPPNPYYTVADYYYPMQQITDGNEAEGIIVAVDKQRNLKSYKFTNRKAYVKVSHFEIVLCSVTKQKGPSLDLFITHTLFSRLTASFMRSQLCKQLFSVILIVLFAITQGTCVLYMKHYR
ncbi:hypothetical protein PHET_11744 [Paragonimus heterotremus]|uniref:Uncharacterized protein n=1 Tax=Paragonimus heterotremus TaxID=100268 RepID=A0A8J4T0J1_9TREM|nr:hypothetical protein PHET_11744 [Paragonimus heterotremus]